MEPCCRPVAIDRTRDVVANDGAEYGTVVAKTNVLRLDGVIPRNSGKVVHIRRDDPNRVRTRREGNVVGVNHVECQQKGRAVVVLRMCHVDVHVDAVDAVV